MAGTWMCVIFFQSPPTWLILFYLMEYVLISSCYFYYRCGHWCYYRWRPSRSTHERWLLCCWCFAVVKCAMLPHLRHLCSANYFASTGVKESERTFIGSHQTSWFLFCAHVLLKKKLLWRCITYVFLPTKIPSSPINNNKNIQQSSIYRENKARMHTMSCEIIIAWMPRTSLRSEREGTNTMKTNFRPHSH